MPPAQPNGSKREISLSPEKPKKCGQGGGLGSCGGWGSCGGRGGQGGQGSQGISARSGDQKESGGQGTAEGENDGTQDEIEIIEDDDVFTNTRRTDDERSVLFEYYLGTEADDVFDKLKSNATCAHEKVV